MTDHNPTEHRMTSPFHAAARGLWLTHVGFLLTVGGVVSSLVLWWFIAVVIYYRDQSRWLFLGVTGVTRMEARGECPWMVWKKPPLGGLG